MMVNNPDEQATKLPYFPQNEFAVQIHLIYTEQSLNPAANEPSTVYTEKDGSNAPSPKALTIKFH